MTQHQTESQFIFTLKLSVFVCLFSRAAGQRGRACDAAGLQHGESSLFKVAEEPKSAAAGGRTHRVV